MRGFMMPRGSLGVVAAPPACLDTAATRVGVRAVRRLTGKLRQANPREGLGSGDEEDSPERKVAVEVMRPVDNAMSFCVWKRIE